MKIAVVGATGLVGREMLTVLEERGFAGHEIIAAASAKSVGTTIGFAGRELTVVSVEEAIAAQADYAIFSAGSEASKQYAPQFVAAGTTVIDNSSAWRKDSHVTLVVPEINIDAAIKALEQANNHAIIIANPNCSTIQMVLALSSLEREYGIRRIVISTYQSITGTGLKAVRQLETEEKGQWHVQNGEWVSASPVGVADAPAPVHAPAYVHSIHRNLFPHGGDWLPDGYTTEEQKLVDETRKIFADPDIKVSATVVRVPVVGGHSESINVELRKDEHERTGADTVQGYIDLDEVRRLIAATPGIVVCDDPSHNLYPMPVTAHHRDEVFVGRLRHDSSQPKTLNLWVVADNIRKGAATNAVQIMQALYQREQLA